MTAEIEPITIGRGVTVDNETAQESAAYPAIDHRRPQCPVCGTAAEASSTYCGGCGSTLSHLTAGEARHSLKDGTFAVDPESVVTDESRPPRLKLAAIGLTGVLLVAAAVGAGFVHKETRDELSHVQSRLAASQQDLAAKAFALDTSELRRDDLQTDFSLATEQLKSTKQALETANKELHRTEKQLTGARGTLTDARGRLDLQSNQIATLKSCLDGVSDALKYVAYSDYGAAVQALDAVEVSCETAYNMF